MAADADSRLAREFQRDNPQHRDPIIDAIERHRAAVSALNRSPEQNCDGPCGDAERVAWTHLTGLTPTTWAGAAAYAAYSLEYDPMHRCDEDNAPLALRRLAAFLSRPELGSDLSDRAMRVEPFVYDVQHAVRALGIVVQTVIVDQPRGIAIPPANEELLVFMSDQAGRIAGKMLDAWRGRAESAA